MPQYDFTRPMTFIDALEQFSLALNCVMVALRNEANFNESPDEELLNASHFYVSLLDDNSTEAKMLNRLLERHMLGMS